MSNEQTTTAMVPSNGGFSPSQVDLIKRQIAAGATDDQLALFLEVCRGTGLNPFMRQIYAVFRNAKEVHGGKDVWVKHMTIQTGIDGYRLLAARTNELAGIDDAVYDTEDAAQPGKATVTVYRFVRRGYSNSERVSFTATARWKEYVQTDKNGDPTSMWLRMPYLMLAKCAEALALRKAFPAELSGVYTGEEMMQADNALPRPPTPSPSKPPRLVYAVPSEPEEPESVEEPEESEASEEASDTAAYDPGTDSTLTRLLLDVGVDNIAAVELFAQDARHNYPRTALRAACYKELAERKMRLAKATRQPATSKESVPASLESLKTGKRGN